MKFKIISASELITHLPYEETLIIDLRSKADYDKGHIPDAIWADWETLETDIEPMLRATNHPVRQIILYCDYGNISLLTARDLARIGYSVITVNGGYNAYLQNKSEENH